MAKDVASNNLFGVGALAAMGGAALSMIMPDSGIKSLALIAAGGACMVYDILHISKYDVVFKTLKLGKGEAYPFFKRRTKKDGYALYEFTLPAGLSVDDVRAKQLQIEQYIGKSIELDYGYKNLLIKEFPLDEKTYYDYEPTKLKGNMPLMLGYSRTGELISVDLADGEPHMYIGGETGSGKSTALRAILVNLILHNDIELYLIDLKNGVEFNMFRNCSKVKGFARDEHETLAMLDSIYKEALRRYSLLSDADCENIQSYNKQSKQKLKYQLVAIDEFATLMYEKQSIALLEQLSGKARACGVHLLLSTQRPDAKVISGIIKANISNVLGLKTLDRVNSGIIIGHAGLENLRGKGHAIFKRGAEEVTIQAPYISVDTAKELIAPHIVQKPKGPQSAPKAIESSFCFLDDL